MGLFGLWLSSWRGKRAHRASSSRARSYRLNGLEQVEERRMFSAAPLHVGVVFVEEDTGGDEHGDRFELTFTGGAPGTQLRRVVIDGDQNSPGFGVGDVFFDTLSSGLGADKAVPMTVLSKNGIDEVRWTVVDGTSQLILEFQGFDVGEKLVFEIDVDEVEEYDPSQPDLRRTNEGFDPITSGVEFQGSRLTADFIARHYENATGNTTFRNLYDDLLVGTGLNLPADNVEGKRDRSAAAVAQLIQKPKPISIAGTVYEEMDLDLTREAGEPGIAGVVLQLWRREGNTNSYVFTGFSTTTDANGDYEFGRELGLMPATYQVREAQPTGYFSVGAIPGLVAGTPVGSVVAGDPDILTNIEMPVGDVEAVRYDFAEARPAGISGHVYHDRNDNGQRDPGEEGLGGVAIRLVPIQTIAAQTTLTILTDASGFYQFQNLAPGRYRVEQPSQPTGYRDGKDRAGTVNGVTTGTAVNPGDRIDEISLGGGKSGVDYDFGELLPVALRGRVHLATTDGDCFGENRNHQPLANVTIRLRNAAGQVVGETTTDAQGTYSFADLAPGTYSVEEVTPAGLIHAGQQAGKVNGVTVGRVLADDLIGEIQLQSGQEAVEIAFCEYAPSSLSGYVYHDRNNNGIREAGEEPIAGVSIVLVDSSGQTVGTPRQTDANGYYEFQGIRAGSYSVVETQPLGWRDGLDTPGTIDGSRNGVAINPGDRLTQISLGWGQQGIEYNFGELRSGTLSGIVHTDIQRDCVFDPSIGERPLSGVTIELLSATGTVIQTTQTDATGRYTFTDLAPGEYAVRERQPVDYFHGGQVAGSHGGNATVADLIAGVIVTSGAVLTDYNFCDEEPVSISGYVFQDGPVIRLLPGQTLPSNLREIRDGRRTPDDSPLAGVTLTLRDGISGYEILAGQALPGRYGAGAIRATTDGQGFYQFTGLRAGTYAVFQSQPTGFIDSLDTAGVVRTSSGHNGNSGISFNHGDPTPVNIRAALGVDPQNDAIVRISLPPGSTGEFYNFSEVIADQTLIPPPQRPPAPLPPPLAPKPFAERVARPLLSPIAPRPLAPFGDGSGGSAGYTWHLSVVDAGHPRGDGVAVQVSDAIWLTAQHASAVNAERQGFRSAQWTLVRDMEAGQQADLRNVVFGLPDSIPVAGDFNGDGKSEVGVYYRGQWYIDLNGNGFWDAGDLWAKLGRKEDHPVTGDWDGDGKDDIGIFGRAWPGDPHAVDREPGLPDPDNVPTGREKNVPPDPEDATQGRRILQLTSSGKARADLIDHVFHYGTSGDFPVVGDWNGDGISSIGVFRNGEWHLDMNGDGRFTEADRHLSMGQSGDVPVVGDWDGDGVDEIGFYRNGVFYLDVNGNGHWDAHDRVFELPDREGHPVVGDWNGDGKDEVGLFRHGAIVPVASRRQAG